MSRVINFGEKKEAFERVKHLSRIVTEARVDKMTQRYHILNAIRDTARESSGKFSLYSTESEKSKFVTEIVNSLFIEIPRACDLFDELEIDMIKRAAFQTIEAEQIWLALHEQRWKF